MEAAPAAELAAPAVLQDGTYASQSFLANTEETETTVLPLRHALLKPSFFACTSLASALAKLAVRLEATGAPEARDAKLECLLVMAELLAEYENSMDALSVQRITLCVNCLLDPAMTACMRDTLFVQSRTVFEELVAKSVHKETEKEVARPPHSDVDDVIVFKQLRDKSSLGIMIDIDDNAAVKAVTEFDKELTYDEKLKRVHQLTGYSDPVYCESIVYMKDFDIVELLGNGHV